MGLASRLLPVVALLLLIPGASACSLAGPGPEFPARMWVWDLEAAEAVDEVDLYTRGLDGDCGLVMPTDLDAGRLVYADRAGDSAGVWLRSIGEDRPPRLVFRLDGRYLDLDLHGNLLSIYMETSRAPEGGGEFLRFYHLFIVDLETGARERVDLDTDWLGNPRIEDGVLVWDWVSRDDYHHRLNVYDLEEDEWVYENVSYAMMGLQRGRLLYANADWLIVEESSEVHAWSLTEERRHTLDFDLPYRGGLDGDRLYGTDHSGQMTEWTLPSGAVRTLPEPEKPVFRGSAFDMGLVVTGVYSAEGPSTPPEWMRSPEMTDDHPIPKEWRHERPSWWEEMMAPGPSVLTLLAAVAFALLRRR